MSSFPGHSSLKAYRCLGKRVPGRRFSMCKGPEVRAYPVTRSNPEGWGFGGTAVGSTGCRLCICALERWCH